MTAANSNREASQDGERLFRGEIRRFGSHGAIYAVGAMAMRLVGFVLVPVYTKHLSEAEYGILGILGLLTQVVTTFLSLGLMNALFRHWTGADGSEGRRRLISTTVWSNLVLVGVGVVIFLVAPGWWSSLVLGEARWGGYVLLAVGTGLLDMFTATPLGVVRMEERPKFYVAVMVVRAAVFTGFAAYFVAWRGMGVGGALVANLLGMLSSLALVLPLLVRRCAFVVDLPLLREMMGFGLWYVIGSTSALFLNMGDRYVVNYLMGLSAVGIYTLGHQLATTVNMLGQSFISAFMPMGLKRDVTVDGGRFVSMTVLYFAFGLTWIGLAFSLFSPEIVRLLARNPGYYPALKVVPLLVAAAVAYVLAIAFDIGFFFAGQARYVTWSIVAAVALNVGLNFALIPFFGLIGAAMAAVLASGARVGLAYRWAQRVYPLPYDIRRILLVAGVAVAVHLVIFAPVGDVAMLVAKAAAATGFPAILWAAGILSEYERIEIRRLAARLGGRLKG